LALDPETNRTYVLVLKEVFDRIRFLVEDDTGLSKRAVATLVQGAMKEYDENDPTLDLYQND
jgi:hypothetical protein